MEKAEQVFEAAVQAEEAGDSASAIRLYEQCSRLAPKAPAPRLRLASLLSDCGKWKQAIIVARQVTNLRPRSYRAYCVIARCYRKLGRWKMAERFYRQSLAFKQQSWTWMLLGSVLDRQGRHDEAEECLQKAYKVNPDDDEVHYNLGCNFSREGKFGLAEKHFKRAIEIDPKYALAYAELGAMLVGQENRTKEAISYLKRAIDYDPNDGWSIAYLTNGLIRLRRLKAAEDQYLKLLKLWPTHSLPYWSYGDFLAGERRDFSTAEWYFRKAVEIDPKDAIANYYLGRYLFYCGPEDEAKKFLAKAARLGHAKSRELLRQLKGTTNR